MEWTAQKSINAGFDKLIHIYRLNEVRVFTHVQLPRLVAANTTSNRTIKILRRKSVAYMHVSGQNPCTFMIL